jgi:predicted phosphohydrolase
MRLWALSDPHLTLATPQKAMHVFGEVWRDHEARIERAWRERVSEQDVVLLPGDISWAGRLADALSDLEFLHRLPGTKVLLPGNHERWWGSTSEVRAELPPSLKAISGDHVEVGDWLVFGTRLWEHEEIRCDDLIRWNHLSDKRPDTRTEADRASNTRIYERELGRLERCIAALPKRPWLKRVCMTHYPPIGPDLEPTRASSLVESSGADVCVFGHLHSLKAEFSRPARDLMGEVRGVRYALASCDYLDMTPMLVDET